MQQFIDFISNNRLIVFAWFATLGMLLYTEYMRMFASAKGLSPFAATQVLNSGEALFIDVREANEFKSGHIKGARSVPVNDLDKQMHEIEKFKEKSVVLYCDTGMRTTKVAGKLRKQGFTDVSVITGGLAEWKKASLPLVAK